MEFDNSLNNEVEALIKEIPVQIDRLHHEYSKFFTGAEKRPPVVLREQLEKRTTRLMALSRQISSSVLQFRTQSALSKWNTYKALWDKKLTTLEKA